MLIYSMGVSVDGFIADREGAFGWTVPNEEQFRFHIAQIRELGGYLCGRRLYETMLVWETDPSMRDNELGAAFADIWCAIPKVVFSRTLDRVQGNARLAEASVAEEAAAALDATDKDVSIGGAGLAAAAIELGLVDELRMFRNPVDRRWRHAVPAAGHRRRSARPGRDQDVRLARDLRALRARPRRVGLTPQSESSAPRATGLREPLAADRVDDHRDVEQHVLSQRVIPSRSATLIDRAFSARITRLGTDRRTPESPRRRTPARPRWCTRAPRPRAGAPTRPRPRRTAAST